MDLSLPIKLRRITEEGKKEAIETITSNVSYNGAYVIDRDLKNIKPNDKLHMTLSVSRDEARDFPFSRITGIAKVIRVEKEGCALEFSEHISRFCAAS